MHWNWPCKTKVFNALKRASMNASLICNAKYTFFKNVSASSDKMLPLAAPMFLIPGSSPSKLSSNVRSLLATKQEHNAHLLKGFRQRHRAQPSVQKLTRARTRRTSS